MPDEPSGILAVVCAIMFSVVAVIAAAYTIGWLITTMLT